MAQQHNPLRDGSDGVQRPPVYRVVQQVAHAKPVTQHRPLFYGKGRMCCVSICLIRMGDIILLPSLFELTPILSLI